MKPSQTLRTGWKAVDDDCAVNGLRLTALHAAENSVLYQGTTLEFAEKSLLFFTF
jgi:hypothetical protein